MQNVNAEWRLNAREMWCVCCSYVASVPLNWYAWMKRDCRIGLDISMFSCSTHNWQDSCALRKSNKLVCESLISRLSPSDAKWWPILMRMALNCESLNSRLCARKLITSLDCGCLDIPCAQPSTHKSHTHLCQTSNQYDGYRCEWGCLQFRNSF